MGVLGGVLYGIAGYFQSVALALCGRCLSGISGCSQTLVSAYFARTVPMHQLTGELALSRAMALMGNVLGPAVNAALTPLKGLDDPLLSPCSAAGWLPALLNMLLLGCFATSCFVNVRGAPRNGRLPLLNAEALDPANSGVPPSVTVAYMATSDEQSSSSATSDDQSSGSPCGAPPAPTPVLSSGASLPTDDGAMVAVAASDDHSSLPSGKLGRRAAYRAVLFRGGGWFNLLVSLTGGLQLTSLDSTITPIMHAQFQFGVLENSALFGGFSAVALVMTLVTRLATHTCARRPSAARELPRALVLLGLLLMALGYAMSVTLCRGATMPLWAVLVFGGLVVAGLITTLPASSAVYAHLVPLTLKGELLALQDTCSGIGRIVGPLASTMVLHVGGRAWLFASLGAVHAVTLLAVVPVVGKLKLRATDEAAPSQPDSRTTSRR